VAQGTKECRKRCGIPDADQNTTQRQPRLPSNALPSGFSGPPPESPPPPPPVPSASMPAGSLSSGKNFSANAAADTSNSNLNANTPSSNEDLRPYLIALLTINGVFVVGTLTALFMYVARKRGGRQERMMDPMAPQFAPLRDEKDTEYYDPYHRSPSPTIAEKR
jgi:hypothetical protein